MKAYLQRFHNRLPVIALAAMLIAGAAWPMLPAFSQIRYTMTGFLRCTRDDAIMQAFQLMQGSQGEPSLRRIVTKPMRVLFKDMKTLHKRLKNYDALSWISSYGEQVIFINEKHRDAPPEALAAMIAHEAMHDDEFNSLSEETASWRHEAEVWIEMKSRNPELADIPPGTHPLVDRLNDIETHHRNGTLEAFVHELPGYQGLPEVSPGYGQTIGSKD